MKSRKIRVNRKKILKNLVRNKISFLFVTIFLMSIYGCQQKARYQKFG